VILKQSKPKIIIFLYNRFFDLLIQSNFWLYIKGFLENKNTYQNFEFNKDFSLNLYGDGNASEIIINKLLSSNNLDA
jgi:hypothetical protein